MAVVNAGWDDVPHLTAKKKREMLASTPAYLREARSKGIPAIGEGAIYPYKWEDISCPPFKIPDYYKRFYGLDVGDARTAALFGALDPDQGIIYFYSEYYAGSLPVLNHANSLKSRGPWIKGAVDPASRAASVVDGRRVFTEYRKHGCLLTIADNSVEHGLNLVNTHIQGGTIKFFRTLHHTKGEMQYYRRERKETTGEIKIKKINDHLMDAMRYAVVTGLRLARVKPVDNPVVQQLPHAASKQGAW